MADSASSSVSASSTVRERRPPAGHVVADDQLAVRLDAGEQLVELQGQQPAVGAELDDVALRSRRRCGGPSPAAGRRRRVPDRDEVLDLQRGQRARDLVEAELVALQGGQGLVGAGQDRGGVLQDAALAVDVQRDEAHRLGDRDRPGSRSASPPAPRCGAGCRTPRWGSSGRAPVGRRPAGSGCRRGEHDARRPSCTARAAGSPRTRRPGRNRRCTALRRSVVAEHDQPAGAAAQDPLEPVAQRRAGCDGGRG